MKDYCYRKIKKKFRVFPSRYAGFALARCRRGLGKNPVSKSIATVSETPKGWLWRERGKVYPSATAVAKAMKRESDLAVRRGLSAVIRQVSWIPTTFTGTKIVRAILHKNPVPPAAVARVACRGLAKRRKYKRGGTAVGVARGRDLCNRRNVTMRTIKRLSSYFARHRASRAENAKRKSDSTSAAAIADELWGGTPGMRWAGRFE